MLLTVRGQAYVAPDRVARIAGWRRSIARLVVIGLLVSACGQAVAGPGPASGTRNSPSASTQPSSPPVANCSPPPARAFGSLAYDSSHKQVVLFGGLGNEEFSDTWIWNGICWSQATTAAAPSPRSYAASAFNAATGTVFLYGGRDATNAFLFDAWTWDGSTWNQVNTAGGPNLVLPVAAFDPLTNNVVVFGLTADYKSVQTWTWDGSWQQRQPQTSPTPRVSTAMAYDPVSRRVLLFGGRNPGDLSYLGDTWFWDGSNWSVLNPNSGPSTRQDASMASVPSGVLLYGGVQPGLRNTDTWLWNGTSWQQVMTQHSPPPNATAISTSPGGVLAVVAPIGSTTCQTFEFYQGDWVQR